MAILGLILLSLFILLISFLLFAVMRFEIESQTPKMAFSWGYLLSAAVIFGEDDLIVRMRIFFFKKDFYPLHYRSQQTKKAEKSKKKKKHKKRRKRSLRSLFRLARKLISSFHVKLLRVNIDTDDCISNAYLYPIFYFLNQTRHEFEVNYEGKVDVHLIIENRGIRIIRPLLKFATHSFYHKIVRNHGNAI